LGMVEKH